MGLVPIIPSHGRDVIIGLAWINLEFRDLFGRADSCRLPHKAWIERRLRPQLPPLGPFLFRAARRATFPRTTHAGPYQPLARAAWPNRNLSELRGKKRNEMRQQLHPWEVAQA
jgi:hypothetical protein